MNRTNLYFDAENGVYKAGCYLDIVGSEPDEWMDVSHDTIFHSKRAVLQGEWLGSGPLPRDLALKGSEHGEQTALFCWASAVARTVDPRLGLMFAIPNGGKRDPKTAAMLKAEGVRKGVPDVFLPVPWGGFAGLFIELKKRRVGRTSDSQDSMIADLSCMGYRAQVAYGWREAADIIKSYLELSKRV